MKKSNTNVDFMNFIEQHLSKKNYEKLPILFKSSKRMATMRLKNPKRLTPLQFNVLVELSGLTLEDFKPFIS